MSDTESGTQAGTVTDEAAANYLASLQAALADLPPAEVEEILADVGQHVAEVAAELSGQDQDDGKDLLQLPTASATATTSPSPSPTSPAATTTAASPSSTG